MKRIITILASVLLIAGCIQQDVVEQLNESGYPVFTAAFEETITKTFLDESHKLLWNSEDELTIFTTTYNQHYKFTGETGKNSGSFQKIDSGEFVTGNAMSANYAVYPYLPGNEISNDEVISLTLPAVQAYGENSFGPGANTMVAVTSAPDDYFLPFKNLCGYLVVKLYGEGTVKSVSLKGNNGEKIAGAATVIAKYDENPEITMSEKATDCITLDCGEDGVVLGTTADNATEFWFCIPPVTFSQGFTVDICDKNGYHFNKNVSASRTISRNVTNSMSELKVILPTEPVPEIVDLGLSVLWGSFNVGAEKPEEYGLQYAWGEIDTKNNFRWETYMWRVDGGFTKYNTISSYGIVDNKTILDMEDDVAHIKLCDDWRIPSIDEWDELKTCCTWDNTVINGVGGFKITSKKNGNSIFLPRAGFNGNTSMGRCDYWSSSLMPTVDGENGTENAFAIVMGELGYDDRCNGRPIRPVYGRIVFPESIILSVSEQDIKAKDTYTIVATVSPSNAYQKLLWTSSDESVATVSSNGTVNAIAPGETTITVYGADGNHSASCLIRVIESSAIPEAIDLGLTVKWASYNLGASKPDGLGNYFAWGETEPKSDYSWATYKWCNGSEKTLTKYNSDPEYGNVDNKTELEEEDDAAHIIWGGKWKTPTFEDWQELYLNCTWEWVMKNGMNGLLLTSKITGNSIFLPANGYQEGTSSYSVGTGGYYSSSSLSDTYEHYISMIQISSYQFSGSGGDKSSGLTIRPVCE